MKEVGSLSHISIISLLLLFCCMHLLSFIVYPLLSVYVPIPWDFYHMGVICLRNDPVRLLIDSTLDQRKPWRALDARRSSQPPCCTFFSIFGIIQFLGQRIIIISIYICKYLEEQFSVMPTIKPFFLLMLTDQSEAKISLLL